MAVCPDLKGVKGQQKKRNKDCTEERLGFFLPNVTNKLSKNTETRQRVNKVFN